MKRFHKLMALALIALCLFPLTACTAEPSEPNADGTTTAAGGDGSGNEETPKGPAQVDLAALKASFLSELGITDSVDVAADLLLDLYGIAADDVADAACYMTLDGVFPDEVIMIKATDAEAAARIADALNRRLEEVKIQSENYDPENYALAQKCKVQTTDLYVTLFLSPHYDRMTELFGEAAK